MYLSTGAGLELSPRAITAAEAEFREDHLAGQSGVVHGVKCHVSCHMARYGNAVGRRLFQQEEDILFRLRAEACDPHWLVFVFMSGTVVAPIEARELQRFEIHTCSRSNFNVHLTSVRRIGDTSTATGATEDEYRRGRCSTRC